jgi:hypothetical protein
MKSLEKAIQAAEMISDLRNEILEKKRRKMKFRIEIENKRQDAIDKKEQDPNSHLDLS